jgi:hypothetical protein
MYTLCIEAKADRTFKTLKEAEDTITRELGTIEQINDYLKRAKHVRRSYICKKGKAMVMIG